MNEIKREKLFETSSEKKFDRSTSIQIRTNKHRCFVFCSGHTSLTCVPGIGKKNKQRLNQFGIENLSALYEKYSQLNHSQRFRHWLQNYIGFTIYQARMTTCALSIKLGNENEVDCGLLPLCCSRPTTQNQQFATRSQDKIFDNKAKTRCQAHHKLKKKWSLVKTIDEKKRVFISTKHELLEEKKINHLVDIEKLLPFKKLVSVVYLGHQFQRVFN